MVFEQVLTKCWDFSGMVLALAVLLNGPSLRRQSHVQGKASHVQRSCSFLHCHSIEGDASISVGGNCYGFVAQAPVLRASSSVPKNGSTVLKVFGHH